VQFSNTVSVPTWISFIAFDTLIFTLTLIRACRYYKDVRTPLVTVLVRDGFLYYVVMLAQSIANLILFLILPLNRSALLPLFTPGLRASCSIIGSRIMLNMRGAALGRRHGGAEGFVAAGSGTRATMSSLFAAAAPRAGLNAATVAARQHQQQTATTDSARLESQTAHSSFSRVRSDSEVE